MFKRLQIYANEMYPVIPRLLISTLMVAVQYLAVLTFAEVPPIYQFHWEDLGIGYTVFAFLFLLRIADEFKDLENDRINYPERPLPSGRVYKRDLWFLGTLLFVIMVGINLVLPQPLGPLLLVIFYGFLMTVWFFQRDKIEPSLVLALVTHNPVQLILSFYVIHFVTYHYGLALWTWENVCVAIVLYIPALLWEISRKIKAPMDENQYVTYSQVWGFKGSLLAIVGIAAVGVLAAWILVYELSASVLLIVAYGVLLYFFYRYYQAPAGKNLKTIVPAYLVVHLSIFLILIAMLYF
ncbi:UbiA family prenyltransferase [Jeotgalibaca sp. A127]|uniref:UbiA family prenyltransferase n=1 Tax=Jeotgalibaca sp. A127 TaxID=3457324 RepID=UPI003FD16945